VREHALPHMSLTCFHTCNGHVECIGGHVSVVVVHMKRAFVGCTHTLRCAVPLSNNARRLQGIHVLCSTVCCANLMRPKLSRQQCVRHYYESQKGTQLWLCGPLSCAHTTPVPTPGRDCRLSRLVFQAPSADMWQLRCLMHSNHHAATQRTRSAGCVTRACVPCVPISEQ
jgi:hypothetical protein